MSRHPIKKRKQASSYLSLSALFFLFLLSGQKTAAELSLKKNWIEVSTENFIIYSWVGETRTTRLASNLENFRNVFSLITNRNLPDNHIKMHIYLFPESMPELGLRWEDTYILRPTLRGNYLIMRHLGDLDNTRFIQQAYTRYLMFNPDMPEHPPWHDSGLSNFISTIEIDDKEVRIGEIPAYLFLIFDSHGFKNFDWLINVSNPYNLRGKEADIFYTQSWLLVHYLVLGRDDRDFNAETNHYMRLMKNGESRKDAFEQAYKLKLEDIYWKISKHFRGNVKNLKKTLKEPFAESDIKVHKLSEDIIASKLGFLCLENQNYVCATEFYSHSLDINPERSSSLAGLADVYKFTGRFDEAEPLYTRAIELKPEAAMHYLDFAKYFHERSRQSDNPEKKAKWLDQARKYYQDSLEIDPDNPETLVMYGKTYFSDTEDEDAMLTGLVQLSLANKYLPANARVKLALARGYARAGMEDRAKELAEGILEWSGNPEAAELLRSLKNENPNTNSIYIKKH